MQILKKDIRQKIIDAARDEFYMKGYERASVREIAKASGVSLSNIYNYFPGKDTLLEAVVRDVGLALQNLLSTGNLSFSVSGSRDMTLEQFFDHVTTQLLGIISENRRETIILLEKSAGSAFENTKAHLVSLLAAHFADELKPGGPSSEGVLYDVIASVFVTGIIRLIDNDGDDLSNARNVRLFLKYHLSGINSLRA